MLPFFDIYRRTSGQEYFLVRTSLQGWLKPPFGTIKVTCDGAWCSRTGRGGFGWVARDFASIFKGAGGVGNIMCVLSVVAEEEAVRLALLWCVEGGFESAARLVVSYVTRVGGVHSWGDFEPEWLFNTLASDVNLSIPIF
ncbi:unnamed protein product [Malus baccata var. baccata]